MTTSTSDARADDDALLAEADKWIGLHPKLCRSEHEHRLADKNGIRLPSHLIVDLAAAVRALREERDAAVAELFPVHQETITQEQFKKRYDKEAR